LLEVEALPGTEDAGEGAFVSAVVPANSAKEAERALELALWHLGWRLVSAESTQEFARRCSDYEVDEDIKQLARVAEQTGTAQFHTFHTWVDEQRVN
jgi:hypothetical protein